MGDDKCANIEVMTEMQAADTKARKKALLFIAVVAVLGNLAIYSVENHQAEILDWLLAEAGRVKLKLAWLLAAFSVPGIPVLLGAIYLWRLGLAAIVSGRFPPPGFVVVTDTPVF